MRPVSKVVVTEVESAYIADRIRAFERESPALQQRLAPAVPCLQALPLYSDMGGTIFIHEAGTLILVEGDDGWACEVTDMMWVKIALVNGAKRYAGLQSLLPSRSSLARTCASCGGLGLFAQLSGIGCGECHGLGWHDDWNPLSHHPEMNP